ncbi:MAG: hypothetical protein ACKVXR_13970 [Planctomycetota bacterium]
MLRLLLPLVLALAAPLGFAQQEETRESLNRKAIEALVAKKYDEGIALLDRILVLSPKEKGTAYNLACAYSLKGELDKAFEWIDKAAEWGWGEGEGQIYGMDAKGRISEVEMLKQDPDLENVRKDPRFEKVIERLAKANQVREARKKAGEEYAATAAIHIPEKAKGLAEMPILVVLHDAGSTKDAVVAGRWKEIADELGFALIAPSGKLLVGEEPAKGMTWFDDQAAYKAKYWTFEKPILDAVSAFKKEHPIDKSRLVIAGEGLGGFVAVNAAIVNPGMIKGVVALGQGVNAELMAAKAPTAGKMGLRVRILADPADLSKRIVAEGGQAADAQKVIEGWTKSLQTWGIHGEVQTISADAAAAKAQIVEAIGAVLAREAAAAK